MEQSVPISSNTFWGTPFLEKGPPKITEWGPFDLHWPISRINPVEGSYLALNTHSRNRNL